MRRVYSRDEWGRSLAPIKQEGGTSKLASLSQASWLVSMYTPKGGKGRAEERMQKILRDHLKDGPSLVQFAKRAATERHRMLLTTKKRNCSVHLDLVYGRRKAQLAPS